MATEQWSEECPECHTVLYRREHGAPSEHVLSHRDSPPGAQTQTVIVVQFRRGAGIEGDPVRMVTAYYSLEGEFLAERDSWSR